MRVLGIDPGLSGAYAVLEYGALITAADFPIIGSGKRHRIDGGAFADALRPLLPVGYACIEQVGAMPKQGVSSTFKFGFSAGQILGVIEALEIPIMWVTPPRWKRDLRLSSDKEASRCRAIEWWPNERARFARKKDHQRAEAALIARWAFENGWAGADAA